MILDVREATEKNPPIRLEMTLEQAEWLRDQLSDNLCWVNGFNAASQDQSNGPMGQEGMRELNILLKRNITKKLDELK